MQIAYRETVTRAETMDFTHKKHTGRAGEFARIKIVVEPLPPGSGFVFEDKVVGGGVPKEFMPGVEKGLEKVLDSGVLAGFPVVDLKVSLVSRLTRCRFVGARVRDRGALRAVRGPAEGRLRAA